MTEQIPYLALRAWNRMLGGYQHYSDAQVARATEENAPQDAIFRRQNGEWARLGEVTNPSVIRYFKREYPTLSHYLPEEA